MLGVYENDSQNLEALAKQKDYEHVAKWQSSIINHLYWCAASTLDCNNEMIKIKWFSLENHIHSEHNRHGKIFSASTHGKLVGQERNKKWFRRSKYTTIVSSIHS